MSAEARYTTSRLTLWVDGFMTRFIRVGGVAVIAAVFLIMIFIAAVALPLFRGATVGTPVHLPAVAGVEPAEAPMAFGIDEWGEMPFLLDRAGRLHFRSATAPGMVRTVDPQLGASVTSVVWQSYAQRLVIGTGDGRLVLLETGYAPAFADDGSRRITARPEQVGSFPIGQGHGARPIISIGYGENDQGKLAAALLGGDGKAPEVHALTFTRKRKLGGGGATVVDQDHDLTALVKGTPTKVMVDDDAESVLVLSKEGDLSYIFRDGNAFTLRQHVRPFADLADPTISSVEYVLGDVTVVLGHPSGVTRKFSLFSRPVTRPDGTIDHEPRMFWQTGEFDELPGPATAFHAAASNKSYAVASGSTLSLRHGTSTATRWEGDLGFPIAGVAIGSKYDRLVVLDRQAGLHLLPLHDPHPESGLKALFGKVWYEGQSEPIWDWQSTGGTDDFEPKLSMVPLIFGTLKATIYAMLIAVPIALLAAIYTSEFMHPRFKGVIKPTMEIMAALPSVVLGFLAALLVARLFDDRIPSILCALVLVPAVAMAIGAWWGHLPRNLRVLVKPGYEVFVMLPVLVVTVWVAWSIGPVVESVLFAGDFRAWWRNSTGLSYEQRNSLVVGVMMGFAIIPIIYTIAEDALSNVPKALRSGSLALGGSRWQTAMRVVVPTASAGIFSALMIGFGRAVGETMIVVMATGNTAIMDFNIFNGMRTLSANIATELPEAPQGGTLYRTLFLGAIILFAMTFLINTVAEVMRQRLREKYKTV